MTSSSGFKKYGDWTSGCVGHAGVVDGTWPDMLLLCLDRRQMRASTTAVMQSATTQPKEPPTMAPMGWEVGVNVGVGIRVVEVEFVVMVDEVGVVEEVVAFKYPDGYCVPVLMPLDPVYMGKAIGPVCPTYVSARGTVRYVELCTGLQRYWLKLEPTRAVRQRGYELVLIQRVQQRKVWERAN